MLLYYLIKIRGLLCRTLKVKLRVFFLLEEEPKIISKDLKVKFYQLRDPERRMLYKDWEGFNK